MKFFTILLSLVVCFLNPAFAQEGQPCKSAICKCQREGICGRPHGRAECRVKITAPTHAGLVTLDIRDENKHSRFADGARVKEVGEGTVTFIVGCAYLEPPTSEVFLCLKRADGETGSVSNRVAHTGDLAQARESRMLKMCLLGDDRCERFIEGLPPH